MEKEGDQKVGVPLLARQEQLSGVAQESRTKAPYVHCTDGHELVREARSTGLL